MAEAIDITKIKISGSDQEYAVKDGKAWPLFSDNAREDNKLITLEEVPKVDVDESLYMVIIDGTTGGGVVHTLPNPPKTPGTYGLMATVDDAGEPTYSWIGDLVRFDADTNNGGEE